MERKWSETERKWNEMERKWSETERKWSEMELKWAKRSRRFRPSLIVALCGKVWRDPIHRSPKKLEMEVNPVGPSSDTSQRTHLVFCLEASSRPLTFRNLPQPSATFRTIIVNLLQPSEPSHATFCHLPQPSEPSHHQHHCQIAQQYPTESKCT